MYRKNTSGQHIGFCAVKATDGTALTGATVTVKRSIDGAAQAATTGTVTELANGQYDFAPSAADLNGNNISFLFTATSMIPIVFDIVTTAADPTDSVRFGLTALPNAAAEAAGGLYTRGTGAGQINQPANGMIDINAVRWSGTAVATPKTAGVPVVDWVPSGYRSNTAQAGASGTITLDASASATTDFYKYVKIAILSGTGAGQARICTAYNGTTKVATVTPNWTTAPDATSVFATYPLAIADVEAWLGAVAPAMTGDAYARLGAPAGASVSADVAAVKSDSGAIKTKTDSLTFTSAGKVDSNVVLMGTDTLTSAALAASAATEIASATADELLSGHTTAGTLGKVVSDINSKTTNLPASPAAVGSAMTLDLTQSVPTSNTAQTVGDAFNAARAQGFGRWKIIGTQLNLYASDNTTIVKTFTLDSSSTPTERS